jgi:predicted phosphoadenosine phosphosulfate sulfurtransferase
MIALFPAGSSTIRRIVGGSARHGCLASAGLSPFVGWCAPFADWCPENRTRQTKALPYPGKGTAPATGGVSSKKLAAGQQNALMAADIELISLITSLPASGAADLFHPSTKATAHMARTYTAQNVCEAARERLRYIYGHFSKIYVSFSGGKDSGVLLNLAIDAAREAGRLPVRVLVIDLEAQYRHTIDYIMRMAKRPEVKVCWVCLPIHLRNAVSQFQPHWLCWDPARREEWVRDYPDHPGVITDPGYFPFFRKGMEFEEFVSAYGQWFGGGEDTASLVGIRCTESLNRLRTIIHASKAMFDRKPWSTRISNHLYNFYPLYDWRARDIWIANGKYHYDYNRIYDLMHLAGVSLHQQRLCQPYGDNQRKGLWLFKILEPDTWAKIVRRVEGANFGNRYTQYNRTALGNFRVNLPAGHTYESYARFILDTMPAHLRDHYQKKINKFITWWARHGTTPIPQAANPVQEARKQAPSWRRICKVLLKNDYWCTGLSFSQTKREMERQQALILKYTRL